MSDATNQETVDIANQILAELQQAARDGQMIGNGYYATESEGRAAVADGETFKVQGSGDIAAILYRRISTVQSELLAIYPASAAVQRNSQDLEMLQALAPIDLTEMQFAETDEHGNVFRGVDAQGRTHITRPDDPFDAPQDADEIMDFSAGGIVFARLKRSGALELLMPPLWTGLEDQVRGIVASSFGTACESADYFFSQRTVGGLTQIVRTSKVDGVSTAITQIGNNRFPRLSAAGDKVIYASDRGGDYYQSVTGAPAGGHIEHPVEPLRVIQQLGDSMTAFGYADLVSAHFGVPLVGPSSSALAGIGSQKSQQIAARYGAVPVAISFSGGSIADGANVVTAISVQMLSRTADTPGMVRSLPATIAGIAGTLAATQHATPQPGDLVYEGQGYAYAFTPNAGQTLPVAVPDGTEFHIDPQWRQDSVLLCWIGRNDIGVAGWQETVKQYVASIVAAYRPLVRRIVIIGVTNRTNEPAGNVIYNEIVALNADLAALYPANFCDVRPAYNAGTSDDTPNPAYTDDGLHYNGPGKSVIANAVITFIESKGWFL